MVVQVKVPYKALAMLRIGHSCLHREGFPIEAWVERKSALVVVILSLRHLLQLNSFLLLNDVTQDFQSLGS